MILGRNFFDYTQKGPVRGRLVKEKKLEPWAIFLKAIEYGVLLFFPWTFLFALPFLHFGIWIDTEGVAFIQAFLGGLLALVCAVWTYPQQFLSGSPPHICFQPPHENLVAPTAGIVYGSIATFSMMGVAATALLTLPLHYLIELSWFGHPEGCVGVWTFLCYTFVLFSLDQQGDRRKNVLKKSVMYSTIALLLLSVMHPYFFGKADSTWVIYHFTHYLLWPGIACFLLASQEKVPSKTYIFWLILGALCVAFSLSKTAWIASCVILGLSSVCLFFRYFFFCIKAYFSKIFPSKILFLSMFLLLSVVIAYVLILMCFSDVLPTTLASRATSLKIIAQDLIQSPWRFLTGLGFGQMSDSIIRQTLHIGEKVFINGIYAPTWEGVGRYDSSSLNQYGDVLLGGGFFALLGFMCFHAAPLLSIIMPQHKEKIHPFNKWDYHIKQKLFLVGSSLLLLVICASSWFLMLSTYSLLLIALGLTSGRYTFSFSPFFSGGFRLLSLCFSVVLFLTSYEFFKVGIFFSKDVRTSIPVIVSGASVPLTPGRVERHKGPSGVHLAFWMREYYKRGSHNLDPILMPVLERLYAKPNVVSLTLAESLKDAILHFSSKNSFSSALQQYLKIYPDRPDLFS